MTCILLHRVNKPNLKSVVTFSFYIPKHLNKFSVLTLVPSEQTEGDFWRMVWEKNINRIVLLTHHTVFILL